MPTSSAPVLFWVIAEGAMKRLILTGWLMREFTESDFADLRHNPIDRWWGGTQLTNDNLWRWNPMLIAP